MKKFFSKKGFTLTEMLISVLLLGFVSVMVTVMTSAVLSTTNTMQEVAQAEILGTEAIDNVSRELRFALNIKIGEENDVTFDKDAANKNYTFALDDGGKIVLKQNGDNGDLLFAGSSYGNLKVRELKFSLSDDGASVVIDVSISYGDKMLWSSEVSVKPINGITDV